ncbi:MAG: SHOCT domain-containing protein [Candidatus Paceibacterota bacterium]
MFTYWGYNYGNYGIAGTLLYIFIIIIIIITVIEVISALLSHSRPRTPLPPPVVPPAPVPPIITPLHTVEKSPLEILNDRYARGEINKEEYDQKKLDITHTHQM